jgi:xylulokinase
MLRAVLEGVAMDLAGYCLGVLKSQVELENTMLLCGGGSKSPLWRQIFADVFGMNVLKTNIDQDAASLGAVAIAARAAGCWADYSQIDELHHAEQLHTPEPVAQATYAKRMNVYKGWTEGLSKIP